MAPVFINNRAVPKVQEYGNQADHRAAIKIQVAWKLSRSRRTLSNITQTNAEAYKTKRREAAVQSDPNKLSVTPTKAQEKAALEEFVALRSRLEQNPPGYKCYPRTMQPLRVSIYLLFEEPTSSRGAKVTSIFIFTCILLSILFVVLETMPDLKDVPEVFWFAFETFFVVVFTAEYVLRLLVCDVAGKKNDEDDDDDEMTIFRFVTTPMNVVDVVAVLPYIFAFLPDTSDSVTGILRAVRLVRLFRVFKLARYSAGLKLMIVAMSNSIQALGVLVFFLSIGCVLFSSMMFHVEKLGCPNQADLISKESSVLGLSKWDVHDAECRNDDSNGITEYGLCCNAHGNPLDFPSILSTFWWAVVTMTTVGFGDVYPRTVGGKIIGVVTMLSGILLLALPIALIGAKFQEAYNEHMGPAVQKEDQEEDEQTEMAGLRRMSRRMKLMKFQDKALTRMAKDLAKELDEICGVEEDIRFFEELETELQQETMECCQSIVERLQFWSDVSIAKRLSKEMDTGKAQRDDSADEPTSPKTEVQKLSEPIRSESPVDELSSKKVAQEGDNEDSSKDPRKPQRDFENPMQEEQQIPGAVEAA